jgi:nucleoside-diphosphate-sugar epimerase
MTRVVITGGSGKVGRASTKELLKHSYEVINLDVAPRARGSLAQCHYFARTKAGSGCTSNGENATRPFDRAIAASYRAS